MEEELDPSSMGQSFEKVGKSMSEAQIQELEGLGPLDQNGGLAPEKWLQNEDSPSPTGAKANTLEMSSYCNGFSVSL